MDRVAIKLAAKEKIKGKLWDFWKPTLLVYAIYAAVVGVVDVLAASSNDAIAYIASVFSVAVTLAIIPATFGLTAYYMKLARDEEFSLDLLKEYYPQFVRVFLISVLTAVFIILWSVLFIIPGIIMSLAYGMTVFIAIDDPETEGTEPITRSKEMMKGHKWEYFVFQLSFLGWELLASLTCGLLYIWVYPYYKIADVMWYDKLRELTADKAGEFPVGIVDVDAE